MYTEEIRNSEIVDILLHHGGIDYVSEYLTDDSEKDIKALENDIGIENENCIGLNLFTPKKYFDEIIECGIAGKLLQAIDDLGFIEPSRVQSNVLSFLNDEMKDVLVLSAHGTGKTTAFIISMIIHVIDEIKLPQAIYLCHSRELAIQTYNLFAKLNEYVKYKGGLCCIDTVSPPADAQLLFGTPDVFVSYINEGIIDVSHANFLVVDEFDFLLNKSFGFLDDSIELMNSLPLNTQYAFFSSPSARISIIDAILNTHKDIEIIVDSSDTIHDMINHWCTTVTNKEDALSCVYKLVTKVKNGGTLIFARSSDDVRKCYEYLSSKNIKCIQYYSEMTSEQKDKNFESFYNGECDVLIGTYVISRGFDFPNVRLVINYQMPIESLANQQIYNMYEYCASRTGHFGQNGVCFTITDLEDEYFLKSLSYIRKLKCIEFNQLNPLQ